MSEKPDPHHPLARASRRRRLVAERESTGRADPGAGRLQRDPACTAAGETVAAADHDSQGRAVAAGPDRDDAAGDRAALRAVGPRHSSRPPRPLRPGPAEDAFEADRLGGHDPVDAPAQETAHLGLLVDRPDVDGVAIGVGTVY